MVSFLSFSSFASLSPSLGNEFFLPLGTCDCAPMWPKMAILSREFYGKIYFAISAYDRRAYIKILPHIYFRLLDLWLTLEGIEWDVGRRIEVDHQSTKERIGEGSIGTSATKSLDYYKGEYCTIYVDNTQIFAMTDEATFQVRNIVSYAHCLHL